MKKIFFTILSIFSILAIILFSSCKEEPTPSLYEIPPAGSATPVISSLSPSDQALAGVTQITITGSNFLTTPEYNRVYFNNVPGTVLSATTTSLVVIPPVVISDTVSVRIATISNTEFSNTIQNYKLKPSVAELYPFDASAKKQEYPHGLCVDNSETVYFSLRKTALAQGTKMLPNGATEYMDFSVATGNTESFFKGITFASDNNIYAVTGSVKGVYIVVQGSKAGAFVASSQGISDIVKDIEFDAIRNILWAGGETGIIYRITLDKNVKKFNINGAINALKVAGNDLFVVSRVDGEYIIWKMPIISSDSLGLAEEYFNFSTTVDADLNVNDIEISADNDLYVGTNRIGDPLYVVYPDKSYEVVYPGLISQGAYALAWGSGTILYMSTLTTDADGAEVNKSIYAIDLEKLRIN